LIAITALHIFSLHEVNSSTIIGSTTINENKINFHPYFSSKDTLTFIYFSFFCAYLIFYNPNALGHSDNFIAANPQVTPSHIVPE
jgi:quinol-cytochrome oxidoreductase complex cytochrome b subunit